VIASARVRANATIPAALLMPVTGSRSGEYAVGERAVPDTPEPTNDVAPVQGIGQSFDSAWNRPSTDGASTIEIITLNRLRG